MRRAVIALLSVLLLAVVIAAGGVTWLIRGLPT